MFTDNLDIKQRHLLVSYARKLIALDGQILPAESNKLSILELQCSLDSKEEITCELHGLAEQVTTHRARVSFVLELLGFAYSDGDYHQSEALFVREIAKVFQLSDSLIDDLENWILRQIILVREAEQFLGE